MDLEHNPEMFPEALAQFPHRNPVLGFANTRTRFGKFTQPAAATTTEESSAMPARCTLSLTGVCPTVALHVHWVSAARRREYRRSPRLRQPLSSAARKSINPNLFQDQCYKYGSFGNPDKAVRDLALRHTRDSIAIARGLKSRDISMWFADGSNYPQTTSRCLGFQPARNGYARRG